MKFQADFMSFLKEFEVFTSAFWA